MKGVDEIYYHNDQALWQTYLIWFFFLKFTFFLLLLKKKLKKGNFLPAVSIIDFKIIGKGGHGSVPLPIILFFAKCFCFSKRN